MEALLYFAFWAAIIFLMMRFGCGAHVMGHGHGKGRHESEKGADPDLRWVAPEKAVDPVCGETVATDRARPSIYDGGVYYFCSRNCREIFEAAPDLYERGGRGGENRQLQHSRV